jgi:hypothetical protein
MEVVVIPLLQVLPARAWLCMPQQCGILTPAALVAWRTKVLAGTWE